MVPTGICSISPLINSSTNHRTDQYGGSVENWARLLMEVVEAVSDIWGRDRVGVRLSPLRTLNDIRDGDPETTFGYISEKLSGYALAYLHLVNPAITAVEKGTDPDIGALRMIELIRETYGGILITADGFDHDTAEAWLLDGRADLIAFGRKFLANPDLPERFRRRAPLNRDDPSTYYGDGAKGYIDYLSLAQERGESPKPCVDERLAMIRVGL
jgi:N-ethylmaleimide reductase